MAFCLSVLEGDIMAIYNFAGLDVSFCAKFEHTALRSEKYEINSCKKADIAIGVSEAEISALLKRAPNLTPGEAEYLLLGSEFYTALIDYDGFFLHSSAVMVDGEAYLFSAPCGTGKSTHTQLWLKYFGEQRAKILNDDKPAIRVISGRIMACGTPFSGKTDLNLNEIVPIKGICFLEQSPDNYIIQMSPSKSIVALLNQTIRPRSIEKMDKLLLIIEKVINSIQIYKMGCNISMEAVELSYNTMKNGSEVLR
jgi:hypothetical protein